MLGIFIDLIIGFGFKALLLHSLEIAVSQSKQFVILIMIQHGKWVWATKPDRVGRIDYD